MKKTVFARACAASLRARAACPSDADVAALVDARSNRQPFGNPQGLDVQCLRLPGSPEVATGIR
jgi:hypothetical protein